jgi:hypothetical protein
VNDRAVLLSVEPAKASLLEHMCLSTLATLITSNRREVLEAPFWRTAAGEKIRRDVQSEEI